MLEISLVVIGLFLVILSFFLSEKAEKKGKKAEGAENGVAIWTEKDEKNVRERIGEILARETEEAMIKTDDQLSQISNEKIIAVSDFSDQVLEKIKQNHSEVVFLYDMLNEKDIEIKELIQKIDKAKTNAKDTVRLAVEELQTAIKEENEKPKTAMDMLTENKKTKKEVPEKKTVKEAPLKNKAVEQREISIPSPINPINEMGDNKNSRILKLYEEGKSIVEIAKILGLGQGEVKLVIDLFQGARG